MDLKMPRTPAHCDGCKWWSDLIARSTGMEEEERQVEAVCLNVSALRYGLYTMLGCSLYSPGPSIDLKWGIAPRPKAEMEMEFDTSHHPDNVRWRKRAGETHELPIRPNDLTEFRFYAQGMADTTGKTVYIWINNDPSNSMQCGTKPPEDDRSYAIVRTIRSTKA